MSTLSELLSVETIAATVLGYRMSWVELLGTLTYLWSVWLISRRKMLTWPVGIVSVLLYMALFWQIRLYADALEQVYYLAASCYGWWSWRRAPKSEDELASVGRSGARALGAWIAGTVVVSGLLGVALTRAHLLSPTLFPEPAAYPYVDAFTTIASFAAMAMMATRKIESWVWWIVVDLIGIWLYYIKEVRFVALLYVVLLVLAARGLRDWSRASVNAAATGGTASP